MVVYSDLSHHGQWDNNAVSYSWRNLCSGFSLQHPGNQFFWSFLGKDNTPYPTQANDGTYIISLASCSNFTWDHGKYERHFCHDERSLPILFYETGYNYFGAFCTRVIRLYRDSVHYAFCLAYLVIPDKEISLRSCKGGYWHSTRRPKWHVFSTNHVNCAQNCVSKENVAKCSATCSQNCAKLYWKIFV